MPSIQIAISRHCALPVPHGREDLFRNQKEWLIQLPTVVGGLARNSQMSSEADPVTVAQLGKYPAQPETEPSTLAAGGTQCEKSHDGTPRHEKRSSCVPLRLSRAVQLQFGREGGSRHLAVPSKLASVEEKGNILPVFVTPSFSSSLTRCSI